MECGRTAPLPYDKVKRGLEKLRKVEETLRQAKGRRKVGGVKTDRERARRTVGVKEDS